jgi:hypothetical protein
VVDIFTMVFRDRAPVRIGCSTFRPQTELARSGSYPPSDNAKHRSDLVPCNPSQDFLPQSLQVNALDETLITS